MAKDFTLVNPYAEGMPMKTLAKGSSTVIEAGDMVTLTSGLVTKADHSSASLGYAPFGAGKGETTVQILNDRDAEFIGTADDVFAVTQRGTEVDLVMSGTAQCIDVWKSTTDVFKVSVGTDAGVVGSANDVKVKINKFLY